MKKLLQIHQTPEEEPMQPCEQGQNIKDIAKTLSELEKAAALRDSTVQNISQSLVGIEAAMKEQTQLLRDVAVQNVRIEHLEKHGDEIEVHFAELFNRMRAVEALTAGNVSAMKLEVLEGMTETDTKVNRIMLLVDTLSGKPFLWTISTLLGLIIIGTICDISYHRPLLNTIYGYFK